MSARLTIRGFGAPSEVLGYDFFHDDERDLADGEVRVRMLASPINPADGNWIEGTYGLRPELPETPGSEACGDVYESRSERFPLGTRVIFLGYAHGWQAQRVAGEDELLAVPMGLDVAQLAMLKVNPATAWLLLKGGVGWPADGAVILNAANSGVGQCVVQISRLLGLPCLCFLRRMDDAEMLSQLGATAVFTDDAAGQELAQIFLREHGLRAVLGLNAVGGDSALRLLNLLAAEAVMVTYGAMSRRPLTVPNKFLIFQNIRLEGFWLNAWMKKSTRDEVEDVYRKLLEMTASGDLVQRVDSCYGLPDFVAALERNVAAVRRGKVMFTM